MASTIKIVEIDYSALVNEEDLTKSISEAFGIHGIGVLTVKNVPEFVEARQKLLPLSKIFADLSEDVKAKYVHKESFYSFGWSHGKEKLQGKPDLSKGSYYANPQYDRPIDDEEVIVKYPAFIHPNIWPKEDIPDFEYAFKAMGQIIVHVGELLAKQCDKFVHANCPSYAPDLLHRVIRDSKCCKARLLHYFPLTHEEEASAPESSDLFSSWCGWHNDHGSLTGLTSALYLDEEGKEVTNTDEDAGLYVRNRQSELIKVKIPPDHIAFQIGETAQIHSGGILQATPHAVRGSKMRNVSRETFAVFMEPMWMEPMNVPAGCDPTSTQSQSAAKNLPPGVPHLASRWQQGQTFGEFTDATLSSYY